MKKQVSALLNEGWEKRGVFEEPRLSEVVNNYQELGFLVQLEPYQPNDEEECLDCMAKNPEKYKTVYIKKGHTP